MDRPFITIVDCSTGETITREMTQEEYETYLIVTAPEPETPDAV